MLTAVLLLYVHQQVEILRVSYRIHAKSLRLAKDTEDLRRLKFEVERMRSPNLLQKRLEHLSLPFTLPKQVEVIHIPQASTLSSEAKGLSSGRRTFLAASSSRSFFDFLGQWTQIAQARTEG